ncbi:hypothetical protein IFM89_028366 [Coptis chinensis]|uniref:Uncharacterized protein n=1 Tax=Coptis chinensis TaxID=261450 RepID=A0A835IY77_9MAGN|nr:hypothetical protein IFM89_028366 [Coptis chinensis]
MSDIDIDLNKGTETGARFDDEKSSLMSRDELEKRFGPHCFCCIDSYGTWWCPSPRSPKTLFKEAIHVIICGYEDKSVGEGRLDGSMVSLHEDILTGFKMHARGW